MRLRSKALTVIALTFGTILPVLAQDLDKVYRDESHCLTSADMRGDKDNPISCFCRDAIVEARYVYSAYIQTVKDRNMNGPFLALTGRIHETCGEDYTSDAIGLAMQTDWKWNGPEVVRTYPSADVIERIQPASKIGSTGIVA